MSELKIMVAANITYSGMTYNTRLLIEYKHTGKQWYCYKGRGQNRRKVFTSDWGIAHYWKASGKNVFEAEGCFFMARLAIPTTNDKGNRDIWYINNPGDNYQINKVSKYAQKIHAMLSRNVNPFTNN